jgi:hypothetical protein
MLMALVCQRQQSRASPLLQNAIPAKTLMNLKTAVQATEITEDTEMKRVSHAFPGHLMGEANIYGNPLLLLCALCVLCG